MLDNLLQEGSYINDGYAAGNYSTLARLSRSTSGRLSRSLLPLLFCTLLAGCPDISDKIPSGPSSQNNSNTTTTTTNTGTTSTQPETPEGPVFLTGAGDIVDPDNSNSMENAMKTGELLGQNPGFYFTAGDNDQGTSSNLESKLSSYRRGFEQTWGPYFKINPDPNYKPKPFFVVGNHDNPLEALLQYAGVSADYNGNRKGYYSYDMTKSWIFIALNSELSSQSDKDAQLMWLDKVLNETTRHCAVAVWHRNSMNKENKDNAKMDGELSILTRSANSGKLGAVVIVNGHDHYYGRYNLNDKAWAFVVGTGGYSLYDIPETRVPAVASNNRSHGVLKLTLHPDKFISEFIASDSAYSDVSGGSCTAK